MVGRDYWGFRHPGLMRVCSVGVPGGPDWQRGGSQTLPVFSASDLGGKQPGKRPGRTSCRYILLQPAC